MISAEPWAEPGRRSGGWAVEMSRFTPSAPHPPPPPTLGAAVPTSSSQRCAALPRPPGTPEGRSAAALWPQFPPPPAPPQRHTRSSRSGGGNGTTPALGAGIPASPRVTPRPHGGPGSPLCRRGVVGRDPAAPNPHLRGSARGAPLITPSPAAVLFLSRDSGISAGSGWWGGGGEGGGISFAKTKGAAASLPSAQQRIIINPAVPPPLFATAVSHDRAVTSFRSLRWEI